MRTSNLLAAAAALLVGCDQRGTPPTSYDRIDIKTGSSDSTAGGPTGSTGDTTGNGSGSALLLDTVQLNGPLANTQLVGGQKRALVVYFPADRQAHFLASSDGAVSGSYDRETVWDIDVSSSTEIFPSWATPAENGFRDTLWHDSSPYLHLKYRIYTDVGSTECVVQSAPGAILNISVTAYSQIIPNAAAAGIFPSMLSSATTGSLIFAATRAAPVGTTTFQVRLPAY